MSGQRCPHSPEGWRLLWSRGTMSPGRPGACPLPPPALPTLCSGGICFDLLPLGSGPRPHTMASALSLSLPALSMSPFCPWDSEIPESKACTLVTVKAPHSVNNYKTQVLITVLLSSLTEKSPCAGPQRASPGPRGARSLPG